MATISEPESSGTVSVSVPVLVVPKALELEVPVAATSRRRLSFSEKLQNHLSSSEDDCDVIFIVGPENEKIPALRLALVAASPVFNNLFTDYEDGWDHVYHSTFSKDGIPLTDVDAEAFRIFLKLIIWNDVSVEKLKALELSPKNLLNLVEVCKKFGMKELQDGLETLIEKLLTKVPNYFLTEEFYSLPRNVLGLLLKRDYLPMNEITIFQRVYNWATYHFTAQQQQQNADSDGDSIEQKQSSIREILGDLLYYIRFPTMNIRGFRNCVCPTNILTADEELQIFRYLSIDYRDRKWLDISSLPFNTSRRSQQKRPKKHPNKSDSRSGSERIRIKHFSKIGSISSPIDLSEDQDQNQETMNVDDDIEIVGSASSAVKELPEFELENQTADADTDTTLNFNFDLEPQSQTVETEISETENGAEVTENSDSNQCQVESPAIPIKIEREDTENIDTVPVTRGEENGLKRKHNFPSTSDDDDHHSDLDPELSTIMSPKRSKPMDFDFDYYAVDLKEKDDNIDLDHDFLGDLSIDLDEFENKTENTEADNANAFNNDTDTDTGNNIINLDTKNDAVLTPSPLQTKMTDLPLPLPNNESKPTDVTDESMI